MQPVNSTFQGLIDSDSRYPIGRVTTFPTTKTVPSKGFNFSCYGISNSTNMLLADWWSGLPTGTPVDRESEGTFIAGNNIIEPSTAIAFDWGVGGVPDPVIGRSDLWAARWSGKFFARYSGVYRFFLDSSPFTRVRIKVGSVYYGEGANLFTDSNGNSVDRWDPLAANFAKTRQELYFDTVALTQGNWYDISVELQVPRFLDPQNIATYFCVKYREPDATTNLGLFGDSGGDIVTDYQSDYQDDNGVDIKKALSAGVVNTTAAFLVGSEVKGLRKYSGAYRQNEVSAFQLEVGIPATTNITAALIGGEAVIPVDSTSGFPVSGALNIEQDLVEYTGITATSFTGVTGVGAHSDDALVSQIAGEGPGEFIDGFNPVTQNIESLPKFGLVRIEGGFYDRAGDTDYYSDRIWGSVLTNPVINRDSKSANVVISDSSKIMLEQYNRNFPDNASYSMASYYDKFTEQTPDGISRPICYDRWDIADALRDILTKSNIDPVLLYQRTRHKVTGVFAADYGDYLIKGGLTLDSKPQYGYPRNTTNDGADDLYVWSFGYGTFLYENLMEIVKNFSYQFNINQNGYIRAQPFGWPDFEFSPDDASGELDFIGASWDTDADNINDLNVFKARYRKSSNPGDTVSLAATLPYWNDVDIVVQRHDGASQKIKVDVGGAFVNQLIIDGVTVDGTGVGSDEFDLPARAAGTTWSYYDGIDPALGVNPSEIKLAGPLTYDQRDLTVEVVSGEIRFDAIFLFKQSPRTSVLSLGNDQMGTLSISQNITDQRNEADVIGAERGLFSNVGGNVINPKNPVYIHTVSRAVDLGSIYDDTSDNYVGRKIPVELVDPRIYDQDRADFVSTFSLERFRKAASSGTTKIVFDPTLEPGDSILETDEHSKMVDATQVWIKGMSESFTVDNMGYVSYETVLSSVDPREPMRSMRVKASIDISDFNNEPIINIALYHQGLRISGNDASYNDATRTITISSSPGWDTDMWAGWFYVGENGVESVIASNGANTLVLKEAPFDIANPLTPVVEPVGGNWCITFDPLDSEDIGAPIEIRYDQIANAKIDAYIADSDMHRIADLTLDSRDVVSTWGGNKVIYWTGVINHNFSLFKGDFYASPSTLKDFKNKIPLVVVFNVSYELNGVEKTSVIKSQSTGTDLLTPSSEMLIDGTDSLENPFGAAKIVPKILDSGFYVAPIAQMSSDGSILDAGRLYKYADQGGGVYRLFIEGRGLSHANPFTIGQYDGDLVVCARTGVSFSITNTNADANDGYIDITAPLAGVTLNMLESAGFTGHYSPDHIELPQTADVGDWPWVRIVNDTDYPADFQEADNNGLGLVVKFEKTDFYIEGWDNEEPRFLSGFRNAPVPNFGLEAKYSTISEKELTINYQGSPYVIPAGAVVKHAQIGDDDHYVDNRTVISDDYILNSLRFQIYWSVNDPERLFFSSGANADAHDPSQGLFVIAQIYLGVVGPIGFSGGGAPGGLVSARKHSKRVAANKPGKPTSVLILPTYEVHQLYKNDNEPTHIFQLGTLFEEGEFDEIVNSQFSLPSAPTTDINLSGYENFQEIRDAGISLNVSNLSLDENSNPITFDSAIDDGSIVGKSLVLFLIKLEVYDRAGRKPINMNDSVPNTIPPDDDEGGTPQGVSVSDFFAVPIFWDPGSLYDYVILNENWQLSREVSRQLNLSRVLPHKIWSKI